MAQKIFKTFHYKIPFDVNNTKEKAQCLVRNKEEFKKLLFMTTTQGLQQSYLGIDSKIAGVTVIPPNESLVR
jgi:hypothetical protein